MTRTRSKPKPITPEDLIRSAITKGEKATDEKARREAIDDFLRTALIANSDITKAVRTENGAAQEPGLPRYSYKELAENPELAMRVRAENKARQIAEHVDTREERAGHANAALAWMLTNHYSPARPLPSHYASQSGRRREDDAVFEQWKAMRMAYSRLHEAGKETVAALVAVEKRYKDAERKGPVSGKAAAEELVTDILEGRYRPDAQTDGPAVQQELLV